MLCQVCDMGKSFLAQEPALCSQLLARRSRLESTRAALRAALASSPAARKDCR